MNAEELRAVQAPLKERYRADPAAARVPYRAEGTLDISSQTCTLAPVGEPVVAGLHAAAGGDGTRACAADLLLRALVACAGVTLATVATATGIPVRGGRVVAEAEVDFRGTLGVSKEAPVGLQNLRLRYELDTDASPEQRATLIKLTERYCVVYQSLAGRS